MRRNFRGDDTGRSLPGRDALAQRCTNDLHPALRAELGELTGENGHPGRLVTREAAPGALVAVVVAVVVAFLGRLRGSLSVRDVSSPRQATGSGRRGRDSRCAPVTGGQR